MWRARNRRETSPKELWASDVEALEVSGAPRSDQKSFKEVFKSFQKAPKELLESQNEGQSSPEELHRAFESSKNDLKIKHVNVHKTIEK